MRALSGFDLRGEIITDFARLEALAGDWECLRLAGRRPEIFQTFEWARASWRTLDLGRSLATVVVYAGDEPVGLLPLSLEGRTLRFLAAPEADYNDLLVDSSSAASVLAVALETLLAAESPSWQRCVLENVPEDGNLALALESLPRRLRARVAWGWASPCPALMLEPSRDARLLSLLRKDSLRRHHKKLERQGKLGFHHLEDRAQVRAHLPGFFRQHVRRWAMASEASQFLDPAQRAFYHALADEFDPTGPLRFGVLELDDRPIAYHFGFESDGKLIWYKPTFDVEFWDDGPGEVLLSHLLTYCQEADVRELDFTVGYEAFKYRFANCERHNRRLFLHRSRARTVAIQLLTRARDAVAHRPGISAILRVARVRQSAKVERVRRMLRREGVARTAGVVARQVGRSVWAVDEVLVFALEREAVHSASGFYRDGCADSGIDVQLGTLADLVDLSAAYPDEISARNLRDARLRLKSGEQLFVATHHDQVVHRVWLGLRDKVEPADELGRGNFIPLDSPAPVIYDAWTAPPYRGQGVFPCVLRRLAHRATSGQRTVYIYALSSNSASCRAIEKAGFVPWRTLGRWRLLSRFERRWMR